MQGELGLSFPHGPCIMCCSTKQSGRSFGSSVPYICRWLEISAHFGLVVIVINK
ncbi:unnamed protein product [Brassica rapa subsp. trilocularis]